MQVNQTLSDQSAFNIEYKYAYNNLVKYKNKLFDKGSIMPNISEESREQYQMEELIKDKNLSFSLMLPEVSSSANQDS